MARHYKFGFEEILYCLLSVSSDDEEQESLFETDYAYYDIQVYSLDEFSNLCEDFGITVHVNHNLEQAWMSWSAVRKLAVKLWPGGKKGRRNGQGDLIKDLFLQLAWHDSAYRVGERVAHLPERNHYRKQHLAPFPR